MITRLEKRNEILLNSKIEENTNVNFLNLPYLHEKKNVLNDIIEKIEKLKNYNEKYSHDIELNIYSTFYDKIETHIQVIDGFISLSITEKIYKYIKIETTEALTSSEVRELQKNKWSTMTIEEKLDLIYLYLKDIRGKVVNKIEYWNEEVED